MSTESVKKAINEWIDSIFNIYVNTIWWNSFKRNHRDLYHEIKKNSIFENVHYGEECYILASGPSINNQDLSKLNGKIVFTVNQISRNNQFANNSFKSTYHIWSDNRFFDIDENKPEDIEMLNVILGSKNGYGKPICFFKNGMYNTIKKFKIDQEFECHYYCERTAFTYKRRKVFDFTHPVPCFSTVVHYAIILAVYMGFKRINLLGCDCTGIINTINAKTNNYSKMEYGFQISQNGLKKLNSVINKNNMLVESYAYYKIFENYYALNCYCRNNNVELINLTDGGVLDFLNSKSF